MIREQGETMSDDFCTTECQLFPSIGAGNVTREGSEVHGGDLRLAVHSRGSVALICGPLGDDCKNTLWLDAEASRRLLAQLQDALGPLGTQVKDAGGRLVVDDVPWQPQGPTCGSANTTPIEKMVYTSTGRSILDHAADQCKGE